MTGEQEPGRYQAWREGHDPILAAKVGLPTVAALVIVASAYFGPPSFGERQAEVSTGAPVATLDAPDSDPAPGPAMPGTTEVKPVMPEAWPYADPDSSEAEDQPPAVEQAPDTVAAFVTSTTVYEGEAMPVYEIPPDTKPSETATSTTATTTTTAPPQLPRAPLAPTTSQSQPGTTRPSTTTTRHTSQGLSVPSGSTEPTPTYPTTSFTTITTTTTRPPGTA